MHSHLAISRVPEDVCRKCANESGKKARKDRMISCPPLDHLARRRSSGGEAEDVKRENNQDQTRAPCCDYLLDVHLEVGTGTVPEPSADNQGPEDKDQESPIVLRVLNAHYVVRNWMKSRRVGDGPRLVPPCERNRRHENR